MLNSEPVNLIFKFRYFLVNVLQLRILDFRKRVRKWPEINIKSHKAYNIHSVEILTNPGSGSDGDETMANVASVLQFRCRSR